ncbi:MAG: hypothetical protein JSV71_03855, partial [Nitrospiraceae bacterium]
MGRFQNKILLHYLSIREILNKKAFSVYLSEIKVKNYGTMKKVLNISLCMIALMVFTMWVPDVRAFPTWTDADTGDLSTNCAQCHGDFNQGRYTSLTDGVAWGDTIMNLHKDMLSNDCDTCHSSGGN